MSMDHNPTHLIKNSKFRLLFVCAFFNLTLMPASREFRLERYTHYFKQLVPFGNAWGEWDGAEETIAEIWHADENKPEAEFLESRAALPSQGLRIKHKVRRTLEQGSRFDGLKFISHEITYHTLLKDLTKPDIAVAAKREIVSYPRSARSYSLTSIVPEAETVALLVSDISRLRPFLDGPVKPGTDIKK